MICFFDTSALIKNYIEEVGSDRVESILNTADDIYISDICLIECISTLRRICKEQKISKDEYTKLKEEIKIDVSYFKKVNIEDVHDISEQLIDKYQLKSLDSIQLGTALLVKNIINRFVCCDEKLLDAAKKEGLAVINPAGK